MLNEFFFFISSDVEDQCATEDQPTWSGLCCTRHFIIPFFIILCFCSMFATLMVFTDNWQQKWTKKIYPIRIHSQESIHQRCTTCFNVFHWNSIQINYITAVATEFKYQWQIKYLTKLEFFLAFFKFHRTWSTWRHCKSPSGYANTNGLRNPWLFFTLFKSSFNRTWYTLSIRHHSSLSSAAWISGYCLWLVRFLVHPTLFMFWHITCFNNRNIFRYMIEKIVRIILT